MSAGSDRRDLSAWVWDIHVPLGKNLIRAALVVVAFCLVVLAFAELFTYGGPLGISLCFLSLCGLIGWAVKD